MDFWISLSDLRGHLKGKVEQYKSGDSFCDPPEMKRREKKFRLLLKAIPKNASNGVIQKITLAKMKEMELI